MENNKEYFITMLRSTGREGVENVIAELQKSGFFEAPASTKFHLNYEGGLVEHSCNVCREALELRRTQLALRPESACFLKEDSVIIASLLHDVCKADIYVPTTRAFRDVDGSWSKEKSYNVDYSELPVGHGEKSVIRLLQWGLRLTNDEILAIRWHMQAWDLAFQSPEMKANLNAAKEKSPLVSLISASDGLASFVLERRGDDYL